MNFLSLPYLFPIVVFALLTLYPLIDLGVNAYTSVKGFFNLNKGLTTPLTFKERLAVSWLKFKLAVSDGFKTYARFLAEGAKSATAWVTVLAVSLGVALPSALAGYLLGYVFAFYRVVRNAFLAGNEAARESASDLYEVALERIESDLGR